MPTATAGSRTSLEGNARRVNEIKSKARVFGRDIDVYTVGQVICRNSQREAEDYYHYAIIDNADWSAIERMLEMRNITPQNFSPDEYAAKRQYFVGNAIGGYPFVGTPGVFQNCAKVGPEGFKRLNEACMARHGAGFTHAVYQPASRFWEFQGIETALFAGVGLLLIAFAAWRVLASD